MRKLLFAGCVLLALILLAAACGSWYYRSTPQKTVERMLDQLAKGSYARAEAQTVEGTLNLPGSLSRHGKRFYKSMFSSITYVITGVTEDGDEAVVTVAVTMYNIDALLTDTSLELLGGGDSSIFGGGSGYYKRILARIDDGEVSYTLNTVKVYLLRENGRWRVSMSDSSRFASAITGGVGDLIGY